MAMPTTVEERRALRGTKRTCQNPECGSRFYDLNRDPIVCPICQSAYTPIPDPTLFPAPEAKVAKPKRPTPEARPEPEAEIADLPTLEGEDLPETQEADDDALLQDEEEDTGNVEGIIDTPMDEDEKGG
jgi:hypothetical protein